MKKQVLIAAVAATMTSVAMADISITGQMKVNYKNHDTNGTSSNAISHEANLYVKGQNGDSKFHMELDSDSGDFSSADATMQVEDLWMSTKLGDITVKAGTWNGSDTIISEDSARAAGQYSLSTNVSGVGVTVGGGGATPDGNLDITLSGEVAGVKASYKIDDDSNDEVKLATTVSGINVAYHGHMNDTANQDKYSVEVSGSVNGVELAYATAEADSGAEINGDAFFGDMDAVYRGGSAAGLETGSDVQGFSLKTAVAGNTFKARYVTIDATTAAQDTDIVTLIATRPLASGATLEVTYTDSDSVTATDDRETLDVELAVKF